MTREIGGDGPSRPQGKDEILKQGPQTPQQLAQPQPTHGPGQPAPEQGTRTFWEDVPELPLQNIEESKISMMPFSKEEFGDDHNFALARMYREILKKYLQTVKEGPYWDKIAKKYTKWDEAIANEEYGNRGKAKQNTVEYSDGQ